MKPFVLAVFASGLLVLTGCNSGKNNQDASAVSRDTALHAPVNDSAVKTVIPAYAQADPKVAVLIAAIMEQYLRIKNALAGDNHDEAAAGAKVLTAVLNQADKTVFTAAGKTMYEQQEANLKEDAEHIGKTPEIKHQRYHFITLSAGVAALVKGFGGGKTLYIDHCPMANDGKGADWVSELSGIKNPYLGKEMPDCGTVLEKIK